MKIAILGASGRTGMHFVMQALERGYAVTALTRSPEKLAVENPNLSVIVGDALNPADVYRTISGQDAVFIALGTGEAPVKSTIRTDGTQRVVDALTVSGESRRWSSSVGLASAIARNSFRFTSARCSTLCIATSLPTTPGRKRSFALRRFRGRSSAQPRSTIILPLAT